MKARLVLHSDFEFNKKNNTASAMVGLEDCKPVEATFFAEYVNVNKPREPKIRLSQKFIDAVSIFEAEIDDTEVLKKYNEARLEIEKQQKQERTAKREKLYDEHHFHQLIDAAKGTEVQVTLLDREKFIDGTFTMTAELKYRGVKLHVEDNNGKFYAQHYQLFNGARNWVKPESVISKFVEATNDHLKIKEHREASEKLAEEMRDKIAVKLEEFGLKKTNKYSLEDGQYEKSADGSFRARENKVVKVCSPRETDSGLQVSVQFSIPLDLLDKVFDLLN